MITSSASFPPDWLAKDAGPASDLELALLLVNTLDLLEDPPDRLHDLSWLTGVLERVGHAELAASLAPADLPQLRALREAIRPVFEATDAAEVPDLLNPLLVQAEAVPQLITHPDAVTPTLAFGVGRHGVAALEARLPVALAAHVAEQGVSRLGVCASDPCRCAYVDRTRAATRRYCCSWCNDRQAARAYRRRQRG